MISTALHIPIIIGIYLIFSHEIGYLLNESFNKTMGLFKMLGNIKIYRHLQRIIEVISEQGKERRNFRIFYLVTGAFFLLSFYCTINLLGLKSIWLTILISSMPYAWIRIKLTMIQRTGSFEGERLILEIRNQYKLNHNNIIETINRTISHLPADKPLTKRALFRLSLRMNRYKSEEELKEMLDNFTYAINTKWAKMLVNNLYIAAVENVNVTAGLEDLLALCKIINKKIETNRRNNLQSAIMAKALGPIFLLILTWMAMSIMTFQSLLNYQFRTPSGIFFFLLIVLAIFLNVSIVNLANKPVYDI